jgi:hypothetical protein
MQNLTWQQFMDSKKEVENLQWIFEDLEEATPGFIYMDHWYIEQMEDGQFYMMFYNQDWIEPRLDSLEMRLFEILKEENGGAPDE